MPYFRSYSSELNQLFSGLQGDIDSLLDMNNCNRSYYLFQFMSEMLTEADQCMRSVS